MFQNGQFIRLKHQPTQTDITSLTFQVEHHPQNSNRFFFRDIIGGGNLRILPNGAVDLKGSNGPWATFESLQNPNDPSHFLLSCIGHSHPQNAMMQQQQAAVPQPRYLAFARNLTRQTEGLCPFLTSSVDPSSLDCRWISVPVVKDFNQHKELQAKIDEAKKKHSETTQAAAGAKISLVQADAPNLLIEITDQNLFVDFEDEDTVQLVSLATGLAFPYPLTLEISSQRHIQILNDALNGRSPALQQQQLPGILVGQVVAAPNGSSAAVIDLTGKKIVHFLAHDFHHHQKNNKDPQSSHLRPIGFGGLFDTNGGKGGYASFEVIKTYSGLMFQTVMNHPQTQKRCFVAVDAASKTLTLVGPELANANESGFWMLRKVKRPLTSHQQSFLVPRIFDDVDFTPDQKRFFRENGFVIVKNAIQDPSLIAAGLRYLNHVLGQGPKAWKFDEAQQQNVLVGGSHHTMLGLYRVSRIHTLLQKMLGRSNVEPVQGVQLALRFPVVEEFEEGADGVGAHANAQNSSQDNWHIDGQQKASDNFLPFSVIVKVALSDQSKEGCGNLTVFPTSHLRKDVIEWYHSSVSATAAAAPVRSRPSLHDIQPHQICMAAGDCVFCHPYLAHRVGSNVSPHVRYSTIVRVHAKNLDEVKKNRQKLVSDPLHWFFQS